MSRGRSATSDLNTEYFYYAGPLLDSNQGLILAELIREVEAHEVREAKALLPVYVTGPIVRIRIVRAPRRSLLSLSGGRQRGEQPVWATRTGCASRLWN